MANFQVNVPIVTAEPTIVVTIDPTKPLSPGRHIFELAVTDDSGNQSKPTRAEVIVRDSTAPTAVLDAPAVAEIGASFNLSATRSSDIGGKIVQYRWTLIS